MNVMLRLKDLASRARLILFLPLLLACDPTGSPPILIAQLCVVDDRGVSALKSTLRDVASRNKMRFVDGSEETLQSYKTFQENNPAFEFSLPVTSFGVERADRMGLTAMNMETQSYNIVIGFNVGGARDKGKALAFSEEVIGQLRQRWDVKEIPVGRAAGPLENCANKAPAR